jgi:hypothetical protein
MVSIRWLTSLAAPIFIEWKCTLTPILLRIKIHLGDERNKPFRAKPRAADFIMVRLPPRYEREKPTPIV